MRYQCIAVLMIVLASAEDLPADATSHRRVRSGKGGSSFWTPPSRPRPKPRPPPSPKPHPPGSGPGAAGVAGVAHLPQAATLLDDLVDGGNAAKRGFDTPQTVVHVPGGVISSDVPRLPDVEPYLWPEPERLSDLPDDSPELIAIPVPGGVLSGPKPIAKAKPPQRPPSQEGASGGAPWQGPKRPPVRPDEDSHEEPLPSSHFSISTIWNEKRYFACKAVGNCLQSPSYPLYDRSDSRRCMASLDRSHDFSVVRVTEFNTSKNNNYLTLNGNRYSGEDLKNQTFVLWGNVMYGHQNHSLENQFGRWELCVEPNPVCSDGWKVSPVLVSECPHVTRELPDCELAKPGEMCEGNGKCGTRTDINNCYDLRYSYPASRDVYMKHFSFNVTEALDWFIQTEEMKYPAADVSITAPQENGQGSELWQSHGPCVVDGACLGSPGFPGPYAENESCEAKLPPFSVVKVAEFKTQKFFDQLTINGHRYSGTGLQNHSFVVWSEIIWKSQQNLAGQLGAWQLCVEPPPVCSDGLVLTPVSVWECPAVRRRLPNCIRAKPGELCEGDGKCGTRMDINNCYEAGYKYPASRDVYRKKNGAPVRWLVDGQAVDSHRLLRVGSLKCISKTAMSGLNLSDVTVSLTQPTYITVHSFEEVGGCCHKIEINNVSFNASTFFAKSHYFFMEAARLPVAGQIDWVLCIGKPSPSPPPSPPSPNEDSSQFYYEETYPDYYDTSDGGDNSVVIVVSVVAALSCSACMFCLKRKLADKETENPPSARQNQTSETMTAEELMRMMVVLHALEEAREASERLRQPEQGIALRYILETFPDAVAARMEDGLEKNFHELAPVAVGSEGLGFGKICPRDGQPNCSIVDAVDEQYKGKASHFVSWRWTYTLQQVRSSLCSWSETEQIKSETVEATETTTSSPRCCLWVCFFCCNQYRLESGNFSVAMALKKPLESADKILLLVDAEVSCAKRAWCLFEIYLGLEMQLPITVVPVETNSLVDSQENPVEVDLRMARATRKSDEDAIKEIVLSSFGFDSVNERLNQFFTALFQGIKSQTRFPVVPN